MRISIRPSTYILGFTFLLAMNSGFATTDEAATEIADIPANETRAVLDQPVFAADEGRKCKRTRRTGSNRIFRICTTRAQREKANKESLEFLREQQVRQERYMLENSNTGSVSPN